MTNTIQNTHKYKILFVGGDRGGTREIAVAIHEECKAIEAAINSNRHKTSRPIELTSCFATKRKELVQHLVSTQPDIVHFSGHGVDRQLRLLSEHGSSLPLTAQDAKQIFQNLQHKPRLAVLNTCQSRDIARALIGVLDFVISTEQKLEDTVAIRFAEAFYSLLANGMDVENSYHLAIQSLDTRPAPENLPQLMSRSNVNQSTEMPTHSRSEVLLVRANSGKDDTDASKPAENQSILVWSQSPIPGRFLQATLLQGIVAASYLVADVSAPNFNIAFEIGFAIGRHKPILLTKEKSYSAEEYDRAGIDLLRCEDYPDDNKTGWLSKAVRSLAPISTDVAQNKKAAVYLVEKISREEDVSKLISCIKKTLFYFRNFDPTEQMKLSTDEAIKQVAQSKGIIVHLAASNEADAETTNLRAGFVAGLASGLRRLCLILQPTDGPIRIEDRWEDVRTYSDNSEIEPIIREFSRRISAVTKGNSSPSTTSGSNPEGAPVLAHLNLGAPFAENEFRDLSGYYVKTYEYHRALRGEVRLVIGRKGSGKTALLSQVRDHLRPDRKKIVVDLLPAGYQIRKLNEQVLDYLEAGTREHTVTAFWEYLLLLESCYKVLEKDQQRHLQDVMLTDPYRKLERLYYSHTDRYSDKADFSERLRLLVERIRSTFQNYFGEERNRRLSTSDITKFLYSHDVRALKQQLSGYLKGKNGLWILFDNLDKGWSTHGLTPAEALIIRCLLDASRKLEQDLQRFGVDCHTLIFIRNDVYQWLIEETPDRGKEAIAELDWKDPNDLREIISRRFAYSEDLKDMSFEQIWRNFCVQSVDGTESSQFLIDRCLMRPRFLLELVNKCISVAVNAGHSVIETDDIKKALVHFSKDIVAQISYEIEDVFPGAKRVLYKFQNRVPYVSADFLKSVFGSYSFSETEQERLLEILLWQGFLGVVRSEGNISYIYSVQYDIHRLRELASVAGLMARQPVLYVNPAFWPHLEIAKVNNYQGMVSDSLELINSTMAQIDALEISARGEVCLSDRLSIIVSLLRSLRSGVVSFHVTESRGEVRRQLLMMLSSLQPLVNDSIDVARQLSNIASMVQQFTS